MRSAIARLPAAARPDLVGAGPQRSSANLDWSRLAIIIDSPLANGFIQSYRELKPFWDEEALVILQQGRDDLLAFIGKMRQLLGEIRIVHGEGRAKQSFTEALRQLLLKSRVWIR